MEEKEKAFLKYPEEDSKSTFIEIRAKNEKYQKIQYLLF